MLKGEIVNLLQRGKNLLAFSAGVDSSALFFLLLENGIEFDIATVHYGLREQAKQEIAYAKELAARYNKKIFTADAPKFGSNFEANAREFRYRFFEEIIKKEGYENLLTAHQLNDKLEWLLMRLSSGAGAAELSSMETVSQREGYKIIRPLLECTKEELLNYLEKNGHRYFIDSSNSDKKYLRNRFRPIADELLQFGKEGFVRSFDNLSNEAQFIKSGFKTVFSQKKLRVLQLKERFFAPYAASYTLKELGYLISGKEREALKSQNSLVAGRKWAIELRDNLLYIAPYVKAVMDKKSKEAFRLAKIPPKIRGYCFAEKLEVERTSSNLRFC